MKKKNPSLTQTLDAELWGVEIVNILMCRDKLLRTATLCSTLPSSWSNGPRNLKEKTQGIWVLKLNPYKQ